MSPDFIAGAVIGAVSVLAGWGVVVALGRYDRGDR